MTPYLELLYNSGLINQHGVNGVRIRTISVEELADIAVESVDLSATRTVEPQNNVFSHTASVALSGGTQPCQAMDCRLKRAQELSRFAALFSDKVFVHNILADRRRGSGDPSYKQRFAEDLEVICTLLPLIENGRVVPISTLTNERCLHCVARDALEQGDSRRFSSALRRLSKRYFKETELKLNKIENSCSLSLHGSEELLDHGTGAFLFREMPRFLMEMPRIRAALEREGSITVSPSLRQKLGMEERLAHSVFDTIAFELVASQFLNTSLLTERTLEVDILRSIAPKEMRMDENDQLLNEHLTCIIPFLEELGTKDLLRLRDSDGDALSMFRAALLKAIEEQKTRKGQFTAAEAKALYRDVLEPELARLNTKVKTARRAIGNAALRTGLGWDAAITVGVWYGFLQSSVVEAAKALGFTKIIADSASSLLAAREQPEAIRSEPMYFLWKARKLARS
jgi:hypothetical protein